MARFDMDMEMKLRLIICQLVGEHRVSLSINQHNQSCIISVRKTWRGVTSSGPLSFAWLVSTCQSSCFLCWTGPYCVNHIVEEKWGYWISLFACILHACYQCDVKGRFRSVCCRGRGRRVRPRKCPGSAGVWSSTAVCFRTLGRGQRAPISPHRTQHSSEHHITMATPHIYTTDAFTAI